MSALASTCIQIAARAAGQYLAKEGKCPDGIANLSTPESDELFRLVQDELKRGMAQALQDAKDALECNMPAQAEQTFAASMAICGINGAKAFLALHPEYRKG
jgi:hypothetical protein